MARLLVLSLGVLFLVHSVYNLGIHTSVSTEVEVLDWGFVLRVLDPNTGQALHGFSITLNSNGTIGESNFTSYSLSSLTRTVSNYTESYPNNCTSTIIDQTAVLPSGVSFTMRTQFFDKESWKDLGGFNMSLGTEGVKLSIIFNDTQNATTGATQLWYQTNLDISMLFPDPEIYLIPATWLRYQQLNWINPNASMESFGYTTPVLYNFINWVEARFQFGMDAVLNQTNCYANGLCFLEQASKCQLGPETTNDQNALLQELLDLKGDPEPVKNISLVLTIGMAFGAANSVEWDPDFSVLFDFSRSPTTPSSTTPSSTPQSPSSSAQDNGDPTIGIAVGVTLGAVVVVAIIVVVLVLKVPALRDRFSPMASFQATKKARISKMAGAKEELEKQPNVPEPATANAPTKQWRKSTAPVMVQNTKLAQ